MPRIKSLLYPLLLLAVFVTVFIGVTVLVMEMCVWYGRRPTIVSNQHLYTIPGVAAENWNYIVVKEDSGIGTVHMFASTLNQHGRTWIVNAVGNEKGGRKQDGPQTKIKVDGGWKQDGTSIRYHVITLPDGEFGIFRKITTWDLQGQEVATYYDLNSDGNFNIQIDHRNGSAYILSGADWLEADIDLSDMSAPILAVFESTVLYEFVGDEWVVRPN